MKLKKEDALAVSKMIEKYQHITIITHEHPDGDALGTAIGVFSYLTENRNKDVNIILEEKYPETLAFLFDGQIFVKNHLIYMDSDKIKAEKALAECELIIGVDFGQPQRTGSIANAYLASNAAKLIIDHHPFPNTETADKIICQPERSSASELAFYILMDMPDIAQDVQKLPLLSATALMTGMTTDTNNFSNSTTPETFTMAQILLSRGVNREEILRNVLQRYGENRYRLLGHLLSNKLKITKEGLAYIIINKEEKEQYDIQEGDTEGFVNIPLQIKDVLISILLKEDEDKYRVSIRSKMDIPANKLSKEYFNGGGHLQAAGGKLQIPEDIADKSMAGEYIENSVKAFFKDNIEKTGKIS